MLHYLFQWFVRITGFIPQLIVFRTKVHYEDKTVQGRCIRSKAIVVSNHNNLFDYAVLLFVFWTRALRCAVAEVMYNKNFLMTLFLNLLGCVRVDRDAYDMSFIDRMKRILNRGGVVEIYPEGRLPRKGEEKPLEFKPSYVHLALETGAPIIPVYSNSKLFTREREQLVIGKPIYAEELYDGTLSEQGNIRRINDHVRSKIIELGNQFEKLEEKAAV